MPLLGGVVGFVQNEITTSLFLDSVEKTISKPGTALVKEFYHRQEIAKEQAAKEEEARKKAEEIARKKAEEEAKRKKAEQEAFSRYGLTYIVDEYLPAKLEEMAD